MEVGVGFERADIVDEEFDLFATQCLAEAFAIVDQQCGADSGVAGNEMLQCLWHQARRQCRAAAEMQLAGVELGHLQHVVA
ncbi:hypothetical protein D3C76_1555310 [compost metagenome]